MNIDMNPQQLNSLDPKLREAYERIMGSTVQSSAQPSAPTKTITEKTEKQTALPVDKPVETQTPAATPAPVVSEAAKPQAAASTPVTNTVPVPPSPQPEQHHIVPPAASVPTPTTQATYTAATNPTIPDHQMHAYVSQEVADVKQSIKLIEFVYVIGGIIFFVVYAFFWLKFFNLSPLI